ncbi:MAG: ferrous iron transport protein B [Bacteroidales bacterium]|jgi:ferrous iron transport protein B|nr:ferrous iron transport protein B [Bacteroidales bacterium]
MRSLRELKEGDKGIIIRIRGKGEFRKRIIEMGFVKGKRVTVIKAAPLQDPVEYRILDSDVSLRLEEADLIDVIPESESPGFLEPGNFSSIFNEPDPLEEFHRNGKIIHVALVGNPNSGKTSLFNHASHSREHVGNYAGVTVDSKTAEVKTGDHIIRLTDLPGTYSLSSYSPEELFVRNHLSENRPDLVINVIDASNLERNLYLTTQLVEMGLNVIVALNMYDELQIKGDRFDYEMLGKMTGIHFVPTIASKGKGIKELFAKIIDVYTGKTVTKRRIRLDYGPEVELSVSRLMSRFHGTIVGESFPDRYFAVKLLEKDWHALHYLEHKCKNPGLCKLAEAETQRLEKIFNEDTESLIAGIRYGFIEGALKETYIPSTTPRMTLTRRIDFFLTGRFAGYPIFIFFMWLMFQATFIFGDYPVYLIEKLVEFTGNLLDRIIPDGIINDLVVDGIIGGVGGVIVFLPNIIILFLFISLMEDTGYMARVAFIVDKLMHKIGLHGKSFVPLLMGFGCNVPAIMATRTIESRSDRMVTMLIIPFMSCSARYPVYILLISAFFVSYKGTILFILYLTGIIMAAAVAFLLKKTLFKAKEIPFVMELPPYRMPTAKAILKHTWFKGVQYLRKMGSVILVASVIIWALGYFPRNHERKAHYEAMISQATDEAKIHDLRSAMAREQQEQSYIGRLGKFIEPVIRPLGFDWRMGVSLVAGSAAKEVVVSTMGVLYQTGSDEGVTGLIGKLQQQKYTQGPRQGEPVFTPLVAFAFMIFILIYFPCIAVIAAIRKESGRWKWPAFVAVYTTALAWLAAFAVYQIGLLIQPV